MNYVFEGLGREDGDAFAEGEEELLELEVGDDVDGDDGGAVGVLSDDMLGVVEGVSLDVRELLR